VRERKKENEKGREEGGIERRSEKDICRKKERK
jgi:hypothetical protein